MKDELIDSQQSFASSTLIRSEITNYWMVNHVNVAAVIHLQAQSGRRKVTHRRSGGVHPAVVRREAGAERSPSHVERPVTQTLARDEAQRVLQAQRALQEGGTSNAVRCA